VGWEDNGDLPWLAASCGVAGALLPTVSPYVLAGEGSLREACLTLEVAVSLSVDDLVTLVEELVALPVLFGVAGE